MDTFDCIVVGAGPAGTTIARQTARGGFKTLLIDKEFLPRYKPCGGAITPALSRFLDIDFSKTVERVATGVTFFSRNSRPYTLYPDEMRINMVSRGAFDFLLAGEAIHAGAYLMDATMVRSVEETNGYVRVTTDKGVTLSGKVVVGADGARSIVARAAGLQRPLCGFSIEGELYTDDPGILEEYGDRVFFGFGFTEGGYGWVFPKKDHFSVGVITTRNRLQGMVSIYEQFKASFDFLKRVTEKIRRGWFIPFNRGSRPLNTRRICLAGDAASLVDPFSGEGIYYAIRSGLIAAEIIRSELSGEGLLSARYTKEIDKQIVKDFFYARRFAGLFFKAPSLFYQKSKVIRAYTRLANRQIRYCDVLREALTAP